MFPPEGHTPLEGTSPCSSKGGAPFGLLDAAAPAVSPPASCQGGNDDDAAGSVASTAQTTSTVALLQARATPHSHGYLHGETRSPLTSEASLVRVQRGSMVHLYVSG